MLRLNDIIIKDGVDIIVERASVSIEMGSVTHIKTDYSTNTQRIFNAITGLERVEHGDVIIDHQNILRIRESQLGWLRSRKMGLIYNTPSLVSEYTVFENIELPLIIIGVPKFRRKARVNELVQEFGLFHDLDKKVTELDLAKQQIVSICRALANDPDYIIADSPTMLLNKQKRNFVYSILSDISKTHGKTVVLLSNRDIDEEFVDNTITIENKQFISKDSKNKLRLEDNSIIRKTRVNTLDKMKLAFRDFFDRKVRNFFFILLSSLSLTASILMLFLGDNTSNDFESSLINVVDGQQIDIQKVNEDGRYIPFTEADLLEIDAWKNRYDISSTYVNYSYSVDEVSLVDLDVSEEDKIISALKGTSYNSTTYSWADLITTSIDVEHRTPYEQYVSTLPASMKDADIALSPSEKERLLEEYEENKFFWDKQRQNINSGSLPMDTPVNEYKYTMENGPSQLHDITTPEAVITAELAQIIIAGSFDKASVSNKPRSVEELVGRWLLLDMNYSRAINGYNNDTTTADAFVSPTWMPRNQKSSIVKITGIIDRKIIPTSNIYFTNTHAKNINKLLHTSITQQGLDATYTGLSEYITRVYDYSIVVPRLDAIIPLSEMINGISNISMKHRSNNVTIIRNAVNLRNVINIAGFVLLFMSIVVLSSSLSIVFIGAKRKINIMKAIGLTKFGVFSNLAIQTIMTLVVVHVISNILVIAGIITWNVFLPDLSMTYSLSTSINGFIVSLGMVSIVAFVPIMISTLENPLNTLKES